MIQRIVVINYLGEMMELSLTNPEESGFIITNISGLNPPKTNVTVSESAQIDGGYLTSTHVNSRNIVFTLRFTPNKTIEECRLISYRLFPVKTNTTLLFETENRAVQINGVIESNEAELFSKNSATRISIVCPSPFFQSVGQNIATFGSTEPLFEFEFGNESLEEPLIEMSTRTYSHAMNVVYSGDVDTGGIFTIDFLGLCEGLIITDGRGHYMNIDTSKVAEHTGTAIGPGDRILINTLRGEKGIYLVRNGVSSSAFYCIDRYFEWLYFQPGNNTISYTASTGVDNIIIQVTHPIYYQGI